MLVDEPLKGLTSASADGYKEYFGFAEAPFTLTPDLPFVFESVSHSTALNEITHALGRNEALMVVTGDIGTGKTTLCRIIAEGRGPRTFVAIISNPPEDADDLLRQILDGFGCLGADTSAVVQASRFGLLRTLQQFLASLIPLGAQAIVLVDEAQRLRPEIVEQLRLLSNLETGHHKLLQVILFGQPELEALIARDDLQQVAQRISRRLRLRPLRPFELRPYIDRRLSVARGSEPPRAAETSEARQPDFTTSAVKTIETLSGGIPRVVNLLCDRSLETAWSRQSDTVDVRTVMDAAESLFMDVPFAVRLRSRPLVMWGIAAAILLAVAAAGWWSFRDRIRRPPQPAPAVQTNPPPAASPIAGERSNAPAIALPAPPAAPQPVAAAAAPDASAAPATAADANHFLVVVSSFRTQSRAAEVARDVATLGLPVSTRSTASGWQQVIVGPYASRDQAASARSRLEDAQFEGVQIVDTAQQAASNAVAADAPARPAAVQIPLTLEEVLRRASIYSTQPNVAGLVRLRTQVAARDTSANADQAAEIQSALDQLDRYLEEARRRQLEIDARRIEDKPADPAAEKAVTPP